jgi:hypothetical protein
MYAKESVSGSLRFRAFVCGVHSAGTWLPANTYLCHLIQFKNTGPMKNHAIFLFLAVACTCISGCKKSGSANNTPAYFVKATINGQPFNATSAMSAMSGTRITLSGGVAAGATPGYPTIVLSAGNYTGAGTYDLGITANYGSLDSSFTSTNQVLYGTFTVTAVSPNITGSFSFTCFDSTKVTDGTFSCPKL